MRYFLIAILAICSGFAIAQVLNYNIKTDAPITENPEIVGKKDTSLTEIKESASEEIKEQAPVNATQTLSLSVVFVGSNSSGKTYLGSFPNVLASVTKIADILTGTITFDIESLITEASEATTNWKSKAFFDSATYPTSTFVFVSWKKLSETNYIATGDMTIKGRTKKISFPVTLSEGKYVMDLVVKPTDFGFTTKMINSLKFEVTI